MGDLEPLQQRAEAAAILGEVDRVDRRAEDVDSRPRAGPWRAAAASGRRTGRSRPPAARSRSPRARPRRSAARSRAGRRCRSRSRRSPGLQLIITASRPDSRTHHRGVHAAVVELDPLADPVRPGAEDDDARLVAAADLRVRETALRTARRRPLVGRVVVRRQRLELGRAGVDRLVGADEALAAVALGRELLELAQEPEVDRRAPSAPRRRRRRA